MKTQFYIAILGGAISAAFSFMAPHVPILGIFMALLCFTPLYASFLVYEKNAGFISITSYAIINFVLFNTSNIEHLNTFMQCLAAAAFMESLHRIPGLRFAIQRVINYLTLITPIVFCALAFFDISLIKALENLLAPVLSGPLKAQIGRDPAALLQSVPGSILCFIILTHAMNIKIASHFVTLRGWASQNILLAPNDDQHYNLYYDIVAASGLWLISLGNLIKIPGNLAVMGRTLMIISMIPLFMLGLRVLQILFVRNNWPQYLINIGLIIGILLVHPLLIIVLLGFMESCYNVSQRLLKEKI